MRISDWSSDVCSSDLLAGLLDRADAGQRVGAVDVHRARTADALAAGAAERQRGVDLVLDLDQRVQDHRPAAVQVDLVGVQARILVVVRAPAIDLELAHALRDRKSTRLNSSN